MFTTLEKSTGKLKHLNIYVGADNGEQACICVCVVRISYITGTFNSSGSTKLLINISRRAEHPSTHPLIAVQSKRCDTALTRFTWLNVSSENHE